MVMPDMQLLTQDYPASLITQANWILSTQSRYNTIGVFNVGDVVDDMVDEQKAAAIAMYDIFDTVNMPYLIAAGNHDIYDVARDGTAAFWDSMFPVTRYTSKSWWNGGFEDASQSQNAYLTIGDYLFLTLEFGPRQDVLDWANIVAAANPTKKIVLLTHYMEYDAAARFATTGDSPNPHEYYASDTHDGQEIWDEFGKLHTNIVMAFSGHFTSAGVGSRHTATGDGANHVESMNFPHQGNNAEYIKLVSFYGSNVRIRTYSPVLNAWSTIATNEYWITLP